MSDLGMEIFFGKGIQCGLEYKLGLSVAKKIRYLVKTCLLFSRLKLCLNFQQFPKLITLYSADGKWKKQSCVLISRLADVVKVEVVELFTCHLGRIAAEATVL